jgi:hypothetical protein
VSLNREMHCFVNDYIARVAISDDVLAISSEIFEQTETTRAAQKVIEIGHLHL